MPLNVPASSIVPDAGAKVRKFSTGSASRRISGWIRGWQGGQLVTLWAGVVIVPWQIGVWRELLFRNRFEGFLNPGLDHAGRAGRVAELLVYFVLPLMALLVTVIWVSGRVRRRPDSRG